MMGNLLVWIRIAFMFLFRSTRAAVILSLMILSAVSAMIFLSAMCVGVNDAMIRNSVGLYSGYVTGFNLPSDLPKEKLLVNGVKSVLKRTSVYGILSHGGSFESISMVAVEPDEEAKSTVLYKKTISGRRPAKGTDEIYLSLTVAEKLHVHPGDDVYFSRELEGKPLRLTLSGIYRTGFDQLDRGVAFCSADAVPLEGVPWSAAVFLKEGADPGAVISAYRALLPGAELFESWSESMPDLKQLIDLNYVSMGIVLVLVFGVVSLGIGCAFVIFILKNVREFGIMKAMGVTPWETTGLIFAEVVLMSFLASCAGILLGALITLAVGKTGIDLGHFTSHNRYFSVSGVIYPRLTLFSLLTPPCLALFSGLAAAIWPAVTVVRKRAADILRII
jgi:ABC-type lipoprotein release transport system permease subunit